jgi:hypothetical protein
VSLSHSPLSNVACSQVLAPAPTRVLVLDVVRLVAAAFLALAVTAWHESRLLARALERWIALTKACVEVEYLLLATVSYRELALALTV